MNFDFGYAAELYEKGIHPRVMLGPEELNDLKQRVQDGSGRTILDGLHGQMRELAERVHHAEDLTLMVGQWNHNWQQPGTAVVQKLFDMALAGVLRDDADLIEAVRRVLLAMPDAEAHFGLARRPGYNLPSSLAWAFDLLWDRFSAAERQRFTDWAVPTCVRKTMDHKKDSYYRGAGGNIGLHAMDIPLGTILALRGDDGVPDLETDLQECIRRLEATLHVVFNPDGYPEEDVGYGTSVGGRMLILAEAVRRAGLYDVYRECPRVAKFGRAMLHLVQPWGGWISNTGDHGDDFGNREFALARLATMTKDPSLLWLLGTLTYPSSGHDIHAVNRAKCREVSLGEKLPNVPASVMSLLALNDLEAVEPAHPDTLALPTSYRDRGRGIVSFRSGWEADAAFVVFDGSQRSPAAQGHAHDSCGHFSLSALGEYFGIDTGRYNIEQNCHNVTLIDGKSGRSTDGQWRMSYYYGNLTSCHPGPFTDFASVDSSHQHNGYWAWRHLGLVKGTRPYVWVVDDINKANDWAEYWWQLHTSPENEICLRAEGARVTGWRHGNHLDVHFALPAPDEYLRPHTLAMAQDIAEPSSYKYMDMAANAKNFVRPSDMLHHAVYQRPRLIAKVQGYNGRFMSLMLPCRKDEPPAAVERLASLPASLAVRITFADVEDIVIFAHEHHLLEAADIRGRGKWCVVRRGRASGRIAAWSLGDGTRLDVGGQCVQAAGA